MSLASLRAAIAATLRSPSCRRINFFLGGVHINGPRYAEVATMMETAAQGRNRIEVEVVTQFAGEDAAYISGSNIISVGSDNICASADGRSKVVHECTHALADMDKLGHALWDGASNESAAFIAGFLYEIHEREAAGLEPYAKRVIAPAMPAGRTQFEKYVLASIERETRAGEALYAAGDAAAESVHGRPASSVPYRFERQLRQRILDHPVYAFLKQNNKVIMYNSDGV